MTLISSLRNSLVGGLTSRPKRNKAIHTHHVKKGFYAINHSYLDFDLIEPAGAVVVPAEDDHLVVVDEAGRVLAGLQHLRLLQRRLEIVRKS